MDDSDSQKEASRFNKERYTIVVWWKLESFIPQFAHYTNLKTCLLLSPLDIVTFFVEFCQSLILREETEGQGCKSWKEKERLRRRNCQEPGLATCQDACLPELSHGRKGREDLKKKLVSMQWKDEYILFLNLKLFKSTKLKVKVIQTKAVIKIPQIGWSPWNVRWWVWSPSIIQCTACTCTFIWFLRHNKTQPVIGEENCRRQTPAASGASGYHEVLHPVHSVGPGSYSLHGYDFLIIFK